MKYKLLKEILDFKVGYIIWCDDQESNGYLGQEPWGWVIPVFLMERNPTWFEKI